MSKETPADDPRQQTDRKSPKQTDKPLEGKPGEGTAERRPAARPRRVAGVRNSLTPFGTTAVLVTIGSNKKCRLRRATATRLPSGTKTSYRRQ
jgi:hypothetical protein